jgi:hypothetical protein
MRVNITIPDDWHAALTALAREKNIALGKLLSTEAAKRLPAEVRRQLSEWRGPGREKTAAEK